MLQPSLEVGIELIEHLFTKCTNSLDRVHMDAASCNGCQLSVSPADRELSTNHLPLLGTQTLVEGNRRKEPRRIKVGGIWKVGEEGAGSGIIP